ncbi:DoxX family protein [Stutzerimonas azotifigens]|uniref:DoxX family protein n=1 Tax=Stutzerimonas azotifigens TaxID=291995 RepID=UPI000422F69F|nr:DoxX family protein [Stutzerimonas azotifigens]
MLFVALLVVFTLLAAGTDRLGVPGLPDWRARMRLAMVLALLLIGADHWLTPARYLAMMPGYLPLHRPLVLFTGACEIAGALGLLLPRTRRLAATMLALYFVCVFPANLHNALHGLAVDGLPRAQWYYWLRLPFQPLIIAWALYAGGLLNPRGRCEEPAALRAAG